MQIQNVDQEKNFRKFEVKKGIYQAHYVKDQLTPNPHLVFIQFESKKLNNETMYEAKDIEKTKLEPPSSISQNCGILAPYKKFLYRAEVLEVALR